MFERFIMAFGTLIPSSNDSPASGEPEPPGQGAGLALASQVGVQYFQKVKPVSKENPYPLSFIVNVKNSCKLHLF